MGAFPTDSAVHSKALSAQGNEVPVGAAQARMVDFAAKSMFLDTGTHRPIAQNLEKRNLYPRVF